MLPYEKKECQGFYTNFYHFMKKEKILYFDFIRKYSAKIVKNTIYKTIDGNITLMSDRKKAMYLRYLKVKLLFR